jgi:diaminohydroxyphosphoribosylaminopyrimidine deaminase/5-amino-6-(5-phosphoribosylamino)uracil reductase
VYNNQAKTIIITEKEGETKENLCYETIDFSIPIAQQICTVLFHHQIVSLIVEGGAKTLQTFINENSWDEARKFIGELEFNEGVNAPIIKGEISSEEKILTDLLHYINND